MVVKFFLYFFANEKALHGRALQKRGLGKPRMYTGVAEQEIFVNWFLKNSLIFYFRGN